jgi:hypothetical protein
MIHYLNLKSDIIACLSIDLDKVKNPKLDIKTVINTIPKYSEICFVDNKITENIEENKLSNKYGNGAIIYAKLRKNNEACYFEENEYLFLKNFFIQ